MKNSLSLEGKYFILEVEEPGGVQAAQPPETHPLRDWVRNPPPTGLGAGLEPREVRG